MDILKPAPWSRITGVKQREQRRLGDCCQWKAKGQCSKGDNNNILDFFVHAVLPNDS